MRLNTAIPPSGASRSLLGRLSAILGVALLVAGGLTLADANLASAAQRNDIIDPTSLVLNFAPAAGPTLEVYDQVSLIGAWSIPNGAPAQAGDTFTLTLPSQLQPTTSVAFPLVDPVDPSIVYATCSFPGAAPYVLTCTFTTEVEGKLDVGGDFFVYVVAIQNTNETSVEFEIGSNPVVVTLPGQVGAVCPGICDPDFGPPPSDPEKVGHQQVDGNLFWRIQFQNVTGAWTVSDVLTSTSPAPAHFIVPNSYQVRRILTANWAAQGLNGTGFTSVIGNAVVTPGAATTNVTAFDIAYSGPVGDYIYWVDYETTVVDPYAVGAVFNNTATVSGTVVERTIEVYQGGNGTGSGVTTTTSSTTTSTTTTTPPASTTSTTTVPASTTQPESTSTSTSQLPSSGGPTLPATPTFPPAALPSTGSGSLVPLLMMGLGLALAGSALLISRRPF